MYNTLSCIVNKKGYIFNQKRGQVYRQINFTSKQLNIINILKYFII